MKEKLNQEQRLLCELLACVLQGNDLRGILDTMKEEQLSQVIAIAKRHKVLSLLYDITEYTEKLAFQKGQLQNECRQIVLQNYRLLFLSKYVVATLQGLGIPVSVLKGGSIAENYPTPELRKTGDIDVLVPENTDFGKITSVFARTGIQREKKQWSVHHQVYVTPEGIEIEVHTFPVEPFENKELNAYIAKITPDFFEHVELRTVMGVELPVLEESYQAYQIVIHMLQHFLSAGFGLRLLCDWVVFWNRELQERSRITEEFLQLIQDSKIYGFVRMITAACVEYLGMYREKAEPLLVGTGSQTDVEQFLMEIFEAEEFGNSDATRMVTLQGTGLKDYISLFHHQMKLTYPKAGKCVLLWPVLWVMMLAGFVYRNRRLRKVSSFAVLKKAGKRSQMIKQMNLFEDSRKE